MFDASIYRQKNRKAGGLGGSQKGTIFQASEACETRRLAIVAGKCAA
jgi:hypothetical protein